MRTNIFNKDDYFEFEDLLESDPAPTALDDIFRMKDLKQRKLFLGEINTDTANVIIKHIMQYNADDKDIPPEKRHPITIYIASTGGEIDAGWGIIDIIAASETPVFTINMHSAYSMAFLVALAGHKRYAMPNARFLMHEGTFYLNDSSIKVQDTVDFYRRVSERERDYIVKHSNVTPEEYNSKARVEWYMFADEAKERGFVDAIIGKDCGLGEIV